MLRYIIYLFICFVFCIVFNTTFIKLKHTYKKTHVKRNLKKTKNIPNYLKKTKNIPNYLKKTKNIPTHQNRMKNTNLAKKSNELITIILSKRDAFNERQVIRETWANGHKNIYFIVGKPCMVPNPKSWTCDGKMGNIEYQKKQHKITEKIKKEKNIIILDMVDVYRNLGEKLKLAYQWVYRKYGKKYVLKVDLDTFVRVSSVENIIKDRDKKYECIVGGIQQGSVNRKGKWAENKYKKDTYPPFPSGAGHIISPDLLEYINTHDFIVYQGEDTSLGIFFDESDIKVDFSVSKHITTHSGDCFNKNKFIIGHNINPSKMRQCYKHMDEVDTIDKEFIYEDSLQDTLRNYKLDFPNKNSWSQYGQDLYISKLLPYGKFFIEIGGYDGEKFSNTLLLEKKYHWNGLLIEANPYTYKILKSRNRRAKGVNACLGSGSMTFKISGSTTSSLDLISTKHLRRIESDIKSYGKSGDKRWTHSGEEVDVNCMSLSTMTDVRNIDYFSLDVEGAEIYILNQLDFSKFNIKVFTIEVDQNENKINEIMKNNGYKMIKKIQGDNVYTKKNKVFLCGYKYNTLDFVYPDRIIEDYDKTKVSSSDDVMFNGLHGPSCDINTFKGKIININGEGYVPNVIPKNTFGPGGIPLYYVTLALVQITGFKKNFKKRKNTREKFMYYMHQNCVKYRDEAFDMLSKINHIDAVGKCKNNVKPNIFPKRNDLWTSNWKKPFNQYRFALTMENTKAEGYITEKILMAFLAGNIPIYYGTKEIFDIFNKEAFIYYDIDNPEEAISKIKFLEENPDEYDRMLNENILNENSYEKYFSKESIKMKLRPDIQHPLILKHDPFYDFIKESVDFLNKICKKNNVEWYGWGGSSIGLLRTNTFHYIDNEKIRYIDTDFDVNLVSDKKENVQNVWRELAQINGKYAKCPINNPENVKNGCSCIFMKQKVNTFFDKRDHDFHKRDPNKFYIAVWGPGIRKNNDVHMVHSTYNSIQPYYVTDVFPLQTTYYYDIEIPIPKAEAFIQEISPGDLVVNEYGKNVNEILFPDFLPNYIKNEMKLYSKLLKGYNINNIIQNKALKHCTTKPSGKMWDVFSNAVNILNEMKAPWILYSGSLLFYYRDCKIPHDDLDIQLDLDWMVKNNNKLSNYFLENNFKKKMTFGTIGKMGYEEAWVKDGIKIDIFSGSGETHISGITIHGKTYPCPHDHKYIETHNWNGIILNIPGPVEYVLNQWYGNWKIPPKSYQWDTTPFENGWCIKNM